MTNEQQPRKGRPPAAGEPRSVAVNIRMTPAEHSKWVALGGVDWLRRALRSAFARMQHKEGKKP